MQFGVLNSAGNLIRNLLFLPLFKIVCKSPCTVLLTLGWKMVRQDRSAIHKCLNSYLFLFYLWIY